MTKLLKIRVRQQDFARKHTYRKDYSKDYSKSIPEQRANEGPNPTPLDIPYEFYNIEESDIDRITRLTDTIEYNSFNPELYNLFQERSIPLEYLFSLRGVANKIGVSVWRIEDKIDTVADTIFPHETKWRKPRMETITSQFRSNVCPNVVLLVNDKRLLKYIGDSRKFFEDYCWKESVDLYSIDDVLYDELKLHREHPELINPAFFRTSISNREDKRIPNDVFILGKRLFTEDSPLTKKDLRYRIYINDRMLIERYFPSEIDSREWMLEETVALADLNDTANVQIRSDGNLIMSTIKLDDVTHTVMDTDYQLYI